MRKYLSSGKSNSVCMLMPQLPVACLQVYWHSEEELLDDAYPECRAFLSLG